jgi:hypothetical protein
MLMHAASPAARIADRAVMVDDLLARPRPSADLRNLLAWSVAADPASPAPLLRQAAELAQQTVAQQARLTTQSWAYVNDKDTLASIDYRLGDARSAASSLTSAPWRTQPFGTHLAQFLDRTLRDHGTLTLAGDADSASAEPYTAPSIVIDHGVLRFTLAAPLDQGGRLYAVLYHGGAVAGVLFFRIPPGFSGAQILPLPWARTYPQTDPPPPLWTDGKASITPALYDRRGCFCEGEARMDPNFAPYVPDSALPPA